MQAEDRYIVQVRQHCFATGPKGTVAVRHMKGLTLAFQSFADVPLKNAIDQKRQQHNMRESLYAMWQLQDAVKVVLSPE